LDPQSIRKRNVFVIDTNTQGSFDKDVSLKKIQLGDNPGDFSRSRVGVDSAYLMADALLVI
jgi:hypothetical protein